MVNFCVLSAIAIGVGTAGIVAVSLIYALTGHEVPLDNGVVVDAGSSHSELILYRWLGDKDRGTGNVAQQTSCTVSGGLAQNTNATIAAATLSDCLRNISISLPHGEISTTSIFLGATAGFRLLEEVNPELSQNILHEVNVTFSENGFNPEQVAILTGQQEGLYGWITSNFLSNTLKGPPPLKTVGAMDLGGASTQIAFSEPEENNLTVHLRLYGSNHYVRAQSSLCFGVKELYRRHLQELVPETGAADIIDEPCAPRDYYFNRTCQYLYIDQPCTQKLHPDRQFCNRRQDNKTISFHGTGNASTCATYVAALLNPTKCRQEYEDQHCFNAVVAPTSQTFHAFSSFYYTVDFLNATGKSLTFFRNATRELCSKTEMQIEDIPSSAPNDTLHMFCFQALVIEEMLVNIYSFNESTWGNIQFLKEINHTDAGWALGYMINATNAIPAEDPSEPSISLVGMILVLIICAALLGVGGFFIWKLKYFSSEVNYVQV